MFNRIGGVFLIAMAVLIAVHTVIEPLYHTSETGQPYSQVWEVLNPLMALALLLGIRTAYVNKRAAAGDGVTVTRAYLVSNTLFYGFLFVGIMFLWNWFTLLSPGYSAAGSDTNSLVWILIDAALPLLMGAMGSCMLTEAEAA
ncbi:MAG: hypothetical protein OXI90_02385 [Gammaproteobacteria bacterium]|nr:hypothetical protein [Gammaproteobacteria bacterium]